MWRKLGGAISCRRAPAHRRPAPAPGPVPDRRSGADRAPRGPAPTARGGLEELLRGLRWPGLPLGDEGAPIRPLRVEFRSLRFGVEHAEIGGGVRPRSGHPLPAHRIGGRVPVGQALGKPRQPQPPVAQQMLGQERSRDHACAVVHPAGHIHLAQARIDKGHPGLTTPPGLDRGAVAGPGKAVPFRAPVGLRKLREMMQQVPGEFAPHQLPQKGIGPRRARRRTRLHRLPDPARADLAIGQGLGQIRGGILRRQVAPGRIARQPAVQECIQTLERRARPDARMACQHRRTAAHRGTHLPVVERFACRPVCRRAQGGDRGQRRARIAVLNRAPIGGEHAVRPAALRHHIPRFEQKRPGKRARVDLCCAQRRLDRFVARPRRRIIAARPPDRAGPSLGDQIAQDLQCRAAPQHQTGADRAQRGGEMRHPLP